MSPPSDIVVGGVADLEEAAALDEMKVPFLQVYCSDETWAVNGAFERCQHLGSSYSSPSGVDTERVLEALVVEEVEVVTYGG